MPDVNYAFTSNSADDAVAGALVYASGTWASAATTSALKILVVNTSFANTDRSYVGISVFR
jgi:hypothetical protein